MLKLERSKLLASTMITGVAASMMLVSAAYAQDSAPVPSDEEEVVVTGTRIRNANVFSTSPVTQVSETDIKTQGVTRIEDLVTQLPQAFAAQNSTVANGASGTATVSLRNLGSDRTLVLVDGRRMGYGSPLDAAADLNQIPGAFVERVDVLTGGASAVYGSDALAGVVNFITKKDFEGIQVDAQYGFYQHHNDFDGPGAIKLRDVIKGRAATNPAQFKLPDDNVEDGFSREASILMGVNTADGKGNITAYITYRNNDSVLGGERDYSACSLGGEANGSFVCGGSGTASPGRFTDFDSFDLTLDPATGNFVPWNNATGQYNFGPLNYFQRPDERYGFGANARYEIDEHLEIYGQMMFTDYESVAQIAPSGAFLGPLIPIACDNPLLSAQQSAAIGCSAEDIANGETVSMGIGRRNTEGGGRQDSLNYESYRLTLGARGEIAEGWNYDVAGQFNRVRLSRVYLNDFSNQRLARAFDVVNVDGVPTCRSVVDGTDPSCVPYDIFSNGGVTDAALAYLQIPLTQVGETTEQIFTAEVTGDLGVYGIQSSWAQSPVEVAFGFEFRREELDTVTDAAFASGDGAGQGGPTIGLKGATDVTDLFIEARAPLIEGMPGAELLSIDAAYRYSDYDTGVTTDTYKFGLEYAPVADLRFRASYQQAVRAANVIELFQAQGLNLFDMDFDPCGPNPTATLDQCVATGVPASQYGRLALTSPAGQYDYLQGGNPSVTPEEGETITYGVVFTPSFIDNLVIAVDYYKIEVTNAIVTLDPSVIVSACYDQGIASQCDRINRNALGQLWGGSGGFVESLTTNIGGIETSGIDVTANYSVGLEDYGNLSFAMSGTYLEELITSTGVSEPFDCAGKYGPECSTIGSGAPSPSWRHRLRATWSTPWEADFAVTWRYYGPVEQINGDPTTLDYEFGSENYFDLAATVYLPQDATLRLGVNNVFDNDPPLSPSVGTDGNNNTYPQLYDSMGRYFFAGITAKF